MNLTKKNQKKSLKTRKNVYSHWPNLPVHHDNVVWVHGILWFAKIHYHTCTCTTHFGKPTGFPVPVLNPRFETPLCSHNSTLPETKGVVNIPIYSLFSHLFKSLLLSRYIFTCHYFDYIIWKLWIHFLHILHQICFLETPYLTKGTLEHVLNVLGIFLIWQVTSKVFCSA